MNKISLFYNKPSRDYFHNLGGIKTCIALLFRNELKSLEYK